MKRGRAEADGRNRTMNPRPRLTDRRDIVVAWVLLVLCVAGWIAGSAIPAGCCNIGGGTMIVGSRGIAKDTLGSTVAEHRASGYGEASGDQEPHAGSSRFSRSVAADTALAEEQSAAGVKGEADNSGPKLNDKRLTPTVNVGPGSAAGTAIQTLDAAAEAIAQYRSKLATEAAAAQQSQAASDLAGAKTGKAPVCTEEGCAVQSPVAAGKK